MKKIELIIKDPLGLHARPAGMLAKEARKYNSVITILSGTKKAAATQLITVMTLGIAKGSRITIEVDGIDEDVATEALIDFFISNSLADDINVIM